MSAVDDTLPVGLCSAPEVSMVYRLDLTPHERAALLTVLTDYIGRPDSVEVSIDAASGAEIEVSTLLARVMNAELVEPAS